MILNPFKSRLLSNNQTFCVLINYRIFIERLVTARPHPWGIMYTFIELIKEKGVFRKKSFLKNAEFEEIIKFVFKAMKKGDVIEE